MSDETQTTYYGYEQPGDPDYDTNSAAGIGDRDNYLSASDDHHSVALTQSERRARFGVYGKSTGQPFEYDGRVYYDEDSAPESNRRVDIYSPNGPGTSGGGLDGELRDAMQQSAKLEETGMSDAQLRAKYRTDLPDYYNSQEEDLNHPEEKPANAPPGPKEDLLTKLRKQHPEVANDSDDDLLKKYVQPAFPNVSIDKLAVYAKDPNAAKLIKDEENRTLTPLERFKQTYPDIAKGKSDDDLEHWIYDQQKPDISFDQYKDKLNPPKPSTNAAAMGLLSGMQSTYGKWEQFPKDAANALESLYKGAGVYGWEKSAADWMRTNVPGYAGADDFYQKFIGDLNNRGKEWEKQSAQAQSAIPKDPLAQTLGTGGEIAGSLPDVMVSFGLGSTGRAAAMFGMTYEGTSAYGKAIEEHQKNALATGAEAASMRGVTQFLVNTGMGRVASGFANAVAASSDEEIQKWIRGEPNDITKDTKSFVTGMILGFFMGGHKTEKPSAFSSPLSESGQIIDTEPGEHGPPAPPPTEYTYAGGEDTGATSTFTYHKDAAVNEELNKAADHYGKGNINEAADHLDRSFALMSKDDKQELTKQIISKVEELGTKEQKPSSEKRSDADPFNDYFWSGVPVNPDDLDALLGEGLDLLAKDPHQSRHAVDDLNATLLGMKFPKPGKLDSMEGAWSGYERSIARHEEKVAEQKRREAEERKPKDIPQYDPLTAEEKAEREKALKWEEEYRSKGGNFYAGAPIDPEDLDKMLGKGLEEVSREQRRSRATYSPEKYVDRINTSGDPQEAETAGAIIKSEKGRTVGLKTAVQGEIARKAVSAAPTEMQDKIAKAMRGGLEEQRRTNYWGKFSSQERRQMFVDYQEGKTLTDPIADWMFKNLYGPMYEALNKRDEFYKIVYDARDNYFYQLLTHPKDELARLSRSISKALGGQTFVKPRQMDLVTRLAFGHEMITDNPETLMQMRWDASDRAIEKIRALKQLEEEGLAYKQGDDNIPYQAKEWEVEPTAASVLDPETGEPVRKLNYHISPNIVPLINNSWDIKSWYQSTHPFVRNYFRGLNILKGFTGIKLTWSLFHPLHIAQIAGADIATESQRRLGLGVGNSGDVKNAITGSVPGAGMFHVIEGYRKMADEVNYLKGRVKWSDLTPDKQENVRMFMDMGLRAHTGQERQMMFHQFMTDQLPKLIRDKWRNDPTTSNMARMGYRQLTAEWFSDWWFGELTPRIKMASAVMRRDTLKMTNPELFKPVNRSALLREYQKINRDIEGRFGEMNYDTLLWPRMAKELGTSHMLSLGWFLGFTRTTGDAVIDLTRNAAHMARISKKPGPGFSNRIAFQFNYSAAQLMTGAAITYIATRTIPSLWDMIFPRVGKDENGNDKRVNMQGFMKEFPAMSEYLNTSGSPAGALTKMALNKLNPMISAVVQAAYNKDYMGKPIGNLQDQIAYWMKQSFLPISWENADKTKQTGGGTGDYIMDVLGFTPSGKWTMRSGAENKILQSYFNYREGSPEVANARDGYTRAYNSGNAAAIQEARKNLDRVYMEKYHKQVTPRIIHNLEKDSHKTTAQKIFNQLPHDEQMQRLKEMPPEERNKFLPDASPEVQRELQGK